MLVRCVFVASRRYVGKNDNAHLGWKAWVPLFGKLCDKLLYSKWYEIVQAVKYVHTCRRHMRIPLRSVHHSAFPIYYAHVG